MKTRRELMSKGLIVTAFFWLPKGVIASAQSVRQARHSSPPSQSVVETTVSKIIAGQLEVRPVRVTGGAKLADDLGADSLDIVELSLKFEQAFHLSIPEGDELGWHTVSDVVRYVVAHDGGKSALRNEPQQTHTNTVVEVDVHGAVRWFSAAKRLGMLSRAYGDDVIVLQESLREQDLPIMKVGQFVQYDVVGGGMRKHAENVRFARR